MFSNPNAHLMATGGRLTKEQEKEQQEKFEDFYIDIFDEMAKFGYIEELHVCENLTDHLVGNVYLRYSDEEYAAEALKNFTGRYYKGRILQPEYCVVTEFDQARCRQFDERFTGRSGCGRGGYCNFLHMKDVPREIFRDLVTHQPHRPLAETQRRSRSSSRSSRSSSRSSRSSRGSRSPSRDRRSYSRDRDHPSKSSSSTVPHHHNATSSSIKSSSNPNHRDRSRSRERNSGSGHRR